MTKREMRERIKELDQRLDAEYRISIGLRAELGEARQYMNGVKGQCVSGKHCRDCSHALKQGDYVLEQKGFEIHRTFQRVPYGCDLMIPCQKFVREGEGRGAAQDEPNCDCCCRGEDRHQGEASEAE